MLLRPQSFTLLWCWCVIMCYNMMLSHKKLQIPVRLNELVTLQTVQTPAVTSCFMTPGWSWYHRGGPSFTHIHHHEFPVGAHWQNSQGGDLLYKMKPSYPTQGSNQTTPITWLLHRVQNSCSHSICPKLTNFTTLKCPLQKQSNTTTTTQTKPLLLHTIIF